MRQFRLTALILALSLISAACGNGDDTGGDTTEGTTAPTGASAETEGPEGQELSFTVAVVEPDIASVPILAAVESLADQGHDVDWVEVAEPELAVEGLARREFDLSGESITAALVAIQAGAPITIIGDVVGNAWTLYSQGGISECSQLDGTRIGIFSEGAVATAMVRTWIDQNCPGIEPTYLVIGGSDVRYQALVAGEIDATALELGEAVMIEEEEGDFNLLVNFSEDLSRLRPSAIYANSDFVAESPETVELYLTALLEQHAQINADPAYLADLAAQHLGGDASDFQAVAERYAEMGLYDAAALNEDNLAYTIEFFENAGVIEPGLTPADVSDLGPVQSAAATVGG